MSGQMTGRVARALAVAGFFLFLAPGLARADVDFGVRGGFYSDAEAGFVGVELLADLTRSWYFNPNFEYVFVDEGDLYTVNLDFHYDFPTRNPFYFWVGGGPALIRSETEFCTRRGCDSESENDVGLNLLTGIGFGKGEAIRPYVQGKVVVSDETDAVIAVGLRFF